MPTITGPWSDPRFHDTELLTELAALDADVAVGILLNQTLTDEARTRVLACARLTVANLEEAGMDALMRTSTRNQVDLVLATARKSKAAARQLCEHLSPEAALELYHRTQTTRFAGAVDIAEAIITYTRRGVYTRHHQTAQGRALALEVGPYPHGRVREHREWYLERMAPTCTTVQDLRDLAQWFPDTAELADLEYYQVLWQASTIHEVVLASFGHPEVVREWAEGSDFGVLVAAADPRQSPEYLDGLSVSAPFLEPLLELVRQPNLALLCDRDRGALHQSLDRALDQVQNRTNAMAVGEWYDRLAGRLAVLEAVGTTPWEELSAKKLDRLASVVYQYASTLTKVLLFTHPNARDDGSYTMDNVPLADLPPAAAQAVREALKVRKKHIRADIAAQFALDRGRDPKPWEKLTRTREPYPPENWHQTRLDHVLSGEFTGRPQTWRARLTPELLSELPTATQWKALIDAVAADRVRYASAPVGDTLTIIHQEHPATSGQRYQTLFGNALGDLD